MKQRVVIEIVVQGPDECAADFRKRLQGMLDELHQRDDVDGTPIVAPTASSTGRMTVIVQWQEPLEWSKEENWEDYITREAKWEKRNKEMKESEEKRKQQQIPLCSNPGIADASNCIT